MILYKHLVILRMILLALIVFTILAFVSIPDLPRRHLEKLGRGVVAVRFEEQKVFVVRE